MTPALHACGVLARQCASTSSQPTKLAAPPGGTDQGGAAQGARQCACAARQLWEDSTELGGHGARGTHVVVRPVVAAVLVSQVSVVGEDHRVGALAHAQPPARLSRCIIDYRFGLRGHEPGDLVCYPAAFLVGLAPAAQMSLASLYASG